MGRILGGSGSGVPTARSAVLSSSWCSGRVAQGSGTTAVTHTKDTVPLVGWSKQKQQTTEKDRKTKKNMKSSKPLLNGRRLKAVGKPPVSKITRANVILHVCSVELAKTRDVCNQGNMKKLTKQELRCSERLNIFERIQDNQSFDSSVFPALQVLKLGLSQHFPG